MYHSYSAIGAYRRTKWWIDVVNIILGLFIVSVFMLSLFIPFFKEWRYVLVFGTGAVMNGITGVKKLLEHVRGGGLALLVVAAVLTVLTVLCFLEL